jgi:cell shape-determining protein MreD
MFILSWSTYLIKNIVKVILNDVCWVCITFVLLVYFFMEELVIES